VIEFIRALVPGWARILILLAVVGAVWGHGYWSAWEPMHDELVSREALADGLNHQYRALEQGATDAQATIIAHYTAARAADLADWNRIRVRLDAARRSGVPSVLSEPGSAPADHGDGVEAAGGPSDRDLPVALVDALQVGEELEQTLQICQAELKLCAGMR
jgi:hypothetical protein